MCPVQTLVRSCSQYNGKFLLRDGAGFFVPDDIKGFAISPISAQVLERLTSLSASFTFLGYV